MGPLGLSINGGSDDKGDARLIQAVSSHIEARIGPIAGVFHEESSMEIHVDVHWVAPDEDRPFHTLVTSGASQKPMRPPAGAGQFTHMELVMFLPPTWNLAEPNREETWPILALRSLARYPHKYKTWLWGGHTVPLGYEAAMPFSAGVLTRPYLLDPLCCRLDVGKGRHIELLCLVCLYPQELEFVRRKDAKALIDVAEEADRLEELLVVTKNRPCLFL